MFCIILRHSGLEGESLHKVADASCNRKLRAAEGHHQDNQRALSSQIYEIYTGCMIHLYVLFYFTAQSRVNPHVKWHMQAAIESFVRPKVITKATKELCQVEMSNLRDDLVPDSPKPNISRRP